MSAVTSRATSAPGGGGSIVQTGIRVVSAANAAAAPDVSRAQSESIRPGLMGTWRGRKRGVARKPRFAARSQTKARRRRWSRSSMAEAATGRWTWSGLARLLEVALPVFALPRWPVHVVAELHLGGGGEPVPLLRQLSLLALSRMIVLPLGGIPPPAKPITQSHDGANLPPGAFHIKPLDHRPPRPMPRHMPRFVCPAPDLRGRGSRESVPKREPAKPARTRASGKRSA